MVLDFIIIIPTFNEENVIKKTLLYIKQQKTRASFKALVVDGGSTDRTVEIAQNYVKVIKSPKTDKAYQLNYASAQTNSKYLIFLDADTKIPENYVERIRMAFKHDTELWVCGGHISYVGDVRGLFYFFIVLQALINFLMYAFFSFIWFLFQFLPEARYKIIKKYFFFTSSMFMYYFMRQLLNSPELSGSNICIRRDIFEEIGGFRKPAKLGVDWLFCHAVRTHIRRKNYGKLKMIHSLVVETDVRHITISRSLKRFKTHRNFTEISRKF
ncbi:MAG: glycosyltransferase [Promethearchaeota archaeon]